MSPVQVKSDFVNVRLSEAGRTLAGPNGKIRIANAHMDYSFSGDAPQRILTSEWRKVLSIERCAGELMFELADPAADLAAAVVVKAAAPVTQPAAQIEEK